jgi:acyl carrier protein
MLIAVAELPRLAFCRGGTLLYTDLCGPLDYSFPFQLTGRRMPMAVATKQELAERVKQIISEQLGIDEADITPGASFADDLKADSLDQVELVMALEEAFDLSISDEDAEKILKVQDAIHYVEKHAK